MVIDTRAFHLNTAQKKAVLHRGEPLLLVAGAGTGKTTVITERIRRLFEKDKIEPRQILAVTFTDKAATEMLERVDVVMPLGYEEPWITTFHGFCERVLRREALHLGLDPDYEILTQSGQWLLVREHLYDFPLQYFRPLGNPTKFISAMLTFFSRAKDEVISPADFSTYVKKEAQRLARLKQVDPAEKELLLQHQELADAYQFYEKLMIEQSKLDFGDLILKTITLFKSHPSVLKKYQDQFKHILVDEFQDTNIAQYELIKLLKTPQTQLMVVGDDDQAIYRFRGAAISNILMFKKDFPKSETIVLTQNYRSGQAMLDSARTLICFNNPDRLEHQQGFDKKLKAVRGKLNTPLVIHAPTGEEEAEQVVAKIVAFLESGDYIYKDFAILARANNHLESFAAALKRHGLPFHVAGNRGLYDQDEIKLLIAYLRLLTDPDQDIYLYRLLTSFLYPLSASTLARLLRMAQKQQLSLYELITTDDLEVDKDARQVLDQFLARFTADQLMLTKKTALQILYAFVTESGFVKQFSQTETLQSQLQLKNLNLFFEMIKAFEKDAEEASVFSLVNYLDLLLEAGENPAQAEIEDIDVINLMTVHTAKGLEFKVVFLVNLVSQRFPTRNRKDPLPLPDALVKEVLPQGDEHLQEERRLFYVGMTRSKDQLFLTWADQYGLSKTQKRPSQFLKEIGALTEMPLGQVLGPLHALDSAHLPQMLDRPLVLDDVRPPLKHLSYSHIDTFATCPLKFKYKHILQIPIPPAHAQSFGLSLHRVMRDFVLLQMDGKKADQKVLLSLLKTHWVTDGYVSKKHLQEAYAIAQRMLKGYLKHPQEFLGRPHNLEQKFYLKVGKFPIVGFIDRIDKLPDGTFEIIDYKTGSPKDQKTVDKDQQLTIYALAAKYALKIPVSKLSLYFFENNQKVSTVRSDQKLEKEMEKLDTQIEAILHSDFAPTPGMWCEWCEYKSICPAYKLPVK